VRRSFIKSMKEKGHNFLTVWKNVRNWKAVVVPSGTINFFF